MSVTGRQWVVVSEVDIPFWNLVWFLVKVSLASIPAAIIFAAVIAILVVTVGALFGGIPLAS